MSFVILHSNPVGSVLAIICMESQWNDLILKSKVAEHL